MSSPHDSTDEDQQADLFEERLAQCIHTLSTEGEAALELLLASYAEQSPALRKRLATLHRLGMLADEDDGAGAPAQLGPYITQELLGRGGMSRVYLARHEQTGEQVALKVLMTPLQGDTHTRQRFEREVLAVSALSHPGIVRVHASGTSEGRPWLAMEYVEGSTLDRILDELRASETRHDELEGAHLLGSVGEQSSSNAQPIPERSYVESVCRLLLDIAEALEHAHRFGIVHRDVKPANIAVTPQGRGKLLDLGLASLEGSPSLTRSGDFAGTPYYVAPEQARAVRDADGRSDVFSLGVTLYEALTLVRPFEGSDAAEVFRNLQGSDPVPPARINPFLPRDLETICLCALEKNPQRRYASMGAFATDLQRFLEFKPVLARPVSRWRRSLRLARRHPGWTLLASSVLVILLGSLIGLAFVNSAIRHDRDVARASEAEALRQAQISEAVVSHLVELFTPPADLAGAPIEWGREEMLAASVERIPGELEQDPLLRAALLEAAGRIHANLDRGTEAVPLLDRAYGLRARELESGHPALGSTLVWLSEAHLAADHPQAARALASRGLEALDEGGVSPGAEAAFDLRLTLAEAARQCGDPEQARRELLRLVELCEQPSNGLEQRKVHVHLALAELLLEQQDLPNANAHSSAALAGLRQAWVPDVQRIIGALQLHARIQLARGRNDEATATRSEVDSLTATIDRAQLGISGERWLAEYPLDLLPSWSADFEDEFQRGITGLQSQRPADSIEAFEACLQWAPGHPVTLYNLACAHAIAGDTDAALERLEQALGSHYGTLQGNLSVLREDPDLATLAADPRFEDLCQRMLAGRKLALERGAVARSFLPDDANSSDALPLLIVLGGDARTGAVDRAAHWKAIAESCGAALLYQEGVLAGSHSAWIAEIDNFLEDPWEVEQRPAEQISAFARGQAIDRERVLIVGEGSGAPVAFDLALRAPGFFRAALLLDGIPVPAADPSSLALARACGSRVRVLLGSGAALGGAPLDLEVSEAAPALQTWLRAGGLGASVEVLDESASDQTTQRLCEEVRALFGDA